ncbi:hypothetical protein Tery_1746 [Trichodesmium erythraeum IMS101]|uniref:Uncharacterized protein n=1 Tax=Trichodesmium erythraeum (strain IMS101) TaxID=203124 RepID=Q114R8_TRIEI
MSAPYLPSAIVLLHKRYIGLISYLLCFCSHKNKLVNFTVKIGKFNFSIVGGLLFVLSTAYYLFLIIKIIANSVISVAQLTG